MHRSYKLRKKRFSRKKNGILKILIALLLLFCVLFFGISLIAKYSGSGDTSGRDVLPDEDHSLDDIMITSGSSRPLPSRSFFEELDRESSLDEITEKIGAGGYEGSGIIYRVWMLDDGSKAKLVFNSKGKIEFIYIVTDDSGEIIYDRDNS